MELPAVIAITLAVTLVLYWGAYVQQGGWRLAALAVGAALLAAGIWTALETAREPGLQALNWFVFAAPLLAMAMAILGGLAARWLVGRIGWAAGAWRATLATLALYAVGCVVYFSILVQL